MFDKVLYQKKISQKDISLEIYLEIGESLLTHEWLTCLEIIDRAKNRYVDESYNDAEVIEEKKSNIITSEMLEQTLKVSYIEKFLINSVS